MTKVLLLVLAMVVALTLLPFATAGPTDQPLTIAVGIATASMNPHTNSAATAVAVFLQIYDTLTRFDDRGRLEPALATSWRMVDPQTWEFKLREGVTFHSGHPFSAEDVKFTTEQVLNPESRSVMRTRIELVQRVEVIDPLTVRFVTERPFPILPQNLSVVFMLSKRYFEARGVAAAIDNPSGTGPFKLVSFTRGGESIDLEAFDRYWGGRPTVSRVVFRQIPEGATRVAALLAGEAQIASLVPIDLIDRINQTRGYRISSGFLGTGLMISFNLFVDGPHKNPKVREALRYSVNREVILRDLLKGQGRVLNGQILTPEAFGYNPGLKDVPYDPDRARRLLAEAGYPNGFDLNLITPVGRYLQDREISTAVAAQFQRVGVRTTVQPMDFGTFLTGVRNSAHGVFLIGWLTSPNFDADTALQWFSSTSGLKFTGDQVSDELILRARTTIDPEQRRQLYRRLTEYMHTTLHPGVFLVQAKSVYGVASNVDGFAPRPDEFYNLRRVRLR